MKMINLIKEQRVGQVLHFSCDSQLSLQAEIQLFKRTLHFLK